MGNTIKSGDSGDILHIDSHNRAHVFATSQSEATYSAHEGNSFNVNTGTMILTTDGTSALLHLKNTDVVPWTVGRVFYNAEVSTGGSGGWIADVIANPTGGTIISSGVPFTPANFNFGNFSELTSLCLRGGEGLTSTGGVKGAISTIIPSSGSRVLIPFESVILPAGASLSIEVTPPTGNTSMKIQVGVNLNRVVKNAN